MESEIYQCDVLIIGSGGAGCRAAIEVSKYNLKPIIISKGLSFKSGCTGMAEGGYNAAFAFVDSDDNPDIHYEDTLKGGGFLNDPELARILVDESSKRLVDLENFGALFDRQESGELNQRPFGGQRYRRTCFQGDRTGHEMITALKEEIIKQGIETLDEVMITALILDESGKKVQGAVGVSLKDSRLMIFRAKSTILAAGGAGQIYPVTSNTIQKGGDGFALAWNAGADLIDMEQVQFHPTGMVYPDSRKGVLVTEAVRGEGGLLLDKDENRFMGNYDSRMELATRDVVARAIYNEIMEGRGTENGGVFLDVTHLAPGLIEEKLETMLLQFLDVGVDIRKEPMEVAPTAHHFMGGVKIDKDGKTTLKNLFAAGEVTGGVHGANRLGGNALADTQVFGQRAGESAAKNALKSDDGLNKVFIEREKNRIEGKIKKGDISPQQIKKELQQTMWENVAIIRTEMSLRMALRVINQLESHLQNMDVSGESKFNRDLQNALEVENMIETAKMVITGAVLRQESRGSHYREDFSETRDDWKKSIVLNRNGKIGLIPR
ncbi:fumarate reductase (CoM/CoB) subunit TfrA [Methanobacterium alcaliphilum]|uniref:fumarate reductase (CoM/CoB) subunit TfrA n=1 Tax=Methanobacterium alcaliphilum TaxID=392018 RepID=UPI00200B7C55|nr:fumarate reductase (CoM/CoB) subunit TfrA [Methanobacterium alcaliphilum]MCK9152342.1 fumarate reductase subunit A [Methanobacterium alcaliphilum]